MLHQNHDVLYGGRAKARREKEGESEDARLTLSLVYFTFDYCVSRPAEAFLTCISREKSFK